MEGFDGVRVEGKDDREVWRLRTELVPLALAVVPLVEGRYESTDVMVGQIYARRTLKWVSERQSAQGEDFMYSWPVPY